MIKPETLMAMFSTCDDDAWVGRVCRALGGQNVELDAGQKAMVATICELEKRRDERRARDTERKRAYRAKQKGGEGK